jgi:hypothetical protein
MSDHRMTRRFKNSFTMVPDQVWQVGLSAACAWVYTTLLSFTSKNGESVFPSMDTLCQMTGLSKRTVRAHIVTLVDKQMIIVSERHRSNGSQTSNLYTFTDPSEWDMPGGGGEKSDGGGDTKTARPELEPKDLEKDAAEVPSTVENRTSPETEKTQQQQPQKIQALKSVYDTAEHWEPTAVSRLTDAYRVASGLFVYDPTGDNYRALQKMVEIGVKPAELTAYIKHVRETQQQYKLRPKPIKFVLEDIGPWLADYRQDMSHDVVTQVEQFSWDAYDRGEYQPGEAS